MKTTRRHRRNGWVGLSPLALMAFLFVVFGVFLGSFSKIPIAIVFILSVVYALFTMRGLPLSERIRIFSKGAGRSNLLMMIWIFILAGAFAQTARQMGAVDAMVNLTLSFLPVQMLLGALFVAACLVSFSVGTSVGTIVALVPMTIGLSESSGISLPLLVSAAAGGAFFGDNLSFISDTTVAATRSMDCRMEDKFKVNIRIALPAAVMTFLIYLFLGTKTQVLALSLETVEWIKVLPYLSVIVLAIIGVDVFVVLLVGNVLTGIVGLVSGGLSPETWISAVSQGITDMGELIIISMMAGGLLEVIRFNGGITLLLHLLTRRVHTARGAEYSVAALVGLTNLCTANNTIAILSVSHIARDIADKFGIDRRKCASILDTVSCMAQGLLPYGAQMLIAGALAHISPLEVFPNMFYPALLGLSTMICIHFGLPRLKSRG